MLKDRINFMIPNIHEAITPYLHPLYSENHISGKVWAKVTLPPRGSLKITKKLKITLSEMIADISQKIFNLLIDITSFVYFIIELYIFIIHNVIDK